MRSYFVHTIENQVVLHDHHPECVSPVPSVILDDPMSIDFDPKIEGDQRPTKGPSEDVHEYGVVCREIKVRPGEKGVGYKVTEGVSFLARKLSLTQSLTSKERHQPPGGTSTMR